VRGESAEGLLDRYTGGTPRAAIQRFHEGQTPEERAAEARQRLDQLAQQPEEAQRTEIASWTPEETRTLLDAVTRNPAMGTYLNMANNIAFDWAGRPMPLNENYARELLQLFTLGLDKLNEDGTPVLDANGVPIPAYTETQVQAFARTFSGWTYASAAGCPTKGQRIVWGIMLNGANPDQALGALDAPENNFGMMASGTYYVPSQPGSGRIGFGLYGPAGTQIYAALPSTLYLTEQRR